ncbi:hypothetical protein F4809DRAFT_373760 [Biscogniauxia mediterranea]|nr:hypothetical protein F4809DRAFT_373760 [Biscogniauxia mediterranea]
MPGINQLPEGAEGVAAFVMIYSIASWICSCFMIYLTWVHHERLSYVAIISYWSVLATTASIIQQIHDITFYKDILMVQFERKTRLFDDPELAVANGSFGVDLVLYYIQYYTYNVEAMCVMFWAWELAQSVYGLDAKIKWKRRLRIINKAGPYVSMILPLITVSLLQAPPIQKDFVVFLVLADLPLLLSLTTGSVTMIAILARYVNSKKKFSQWTPPHGSSSGGTGVNSSISTRVSNNLGSEQKSMRRRGIYDRWLMVRFTCAFVLLATFDVTNTLFQITAANNNLKDAGRVEPDFSLSRANTTLFLFLPGNTPGIFVFIIFGTTAGHRKKLAEIFVPRRWQKSPRPRGPRIPARQPSNWERASRRLSEPPPEELQSPTHDVQFEDRYVAKPLPARAGPPPMLRGVLRLEQSTTAHHRQGWDDDHIFNAQPGGVRMQDLSPSRESYDQYYEPNPDYSDDSGPILPIMESTHRLPSG